MSFDPSKHLLPGLPAYGGGRMSDECYDAGVGLHALYNGGKTFEYPAGLKRTPYMVSQLSYMEHCGYTLSAPVGMEGFDRVTCSNGRTSYTSTFRDGMFTLRQTQTAFPAPQTTAQLRAVTETDGEAFDAYLAELAAQGWAIVWQNRMEDNRFFALEKDGRRIYASFFGREGIARFVQDDFGAPIETFGDDRTADGTMQVCQFGLYNSYMIPGRSCDCGMLYIIKLPDDALFLVDGGEYEQATEAACAEILRVMRRMSRTEAGEKIRIAGWLCTHAHNDHMDVFGKLLRLYHDQLDVQRVLFNIPPDGVWGMQHVPVHIMRERLHMYCPDAKYLKCHTGQRFELAGVCFEVLQTHEDGVRSTGRETICLPEQNVDFNDSSVVMKISYEGASFLLLADINKASEAQLLRHFSGETLRSTMMQAAHHLINNLPMLYPIIAPEIVLVPRAVFIATDANAHYTTLLETVPAQNVYFSACATDIFEARDGHFKLVERFPIEGYIYDGSLI